MHECLVSFREEPVERAKIGALVRRSRFLKREGVDVADDDLRLKRPQFVGPLGEVGFQISDPCLAQRDHRFANGRPVLAPHRDASALEDRCDVLRPLAQRPSQPHRAGDGESSRQHRHGAEPDRGSIRAGDLP